MLTMAALLSGCAVTLPDEQLLREVRPNAFYLNAPPDVVRERVRAVMGKEGWAEFVAVQAPEVLSFSKRMFEPPKQPTAPAQAQPIIQSIFFGKRMTVRIVPSDKGSILYIHCINTKEFEDGSVAVEVSLDSWEPIIKKIQGAITEKS